MNLAYVHSDLYEYAPCALARFGSGFVPPPPVVYDLAGPNHADRPKMRVELQRKIWEVLLLADRPLKVQQIRDRIGKRISYKHRNSMGVFIAKWCKQGWVSRCGAKTDYEYFIKGSSCIPKL